VKFVGLKGFCRYSDSKAFDLNEINKMDNVAVALNRVKEADEIEEVCKKIKHETVILNEIAAIRNVSKFKKVVASVGLTPLNNEDIKFLKELGAFAAVIPPELNSEIDSFDKSLKLEVFGLATVEMFYKGKCILSAYFSNKSVKRQGVCRKECSRKWDVLYNGSKIAEITFKPEMRSFNVNGDFVKYEGRQFNKYGVIEDGINHKRSKS